MGLIDQVAAGFKASSQQAEIIGSMNGLLQQLEDELRMQKSMDPQRFEALTREQYLLIAQSLIQKELPYLQAEKRKACMQDAENIFTRIKGPLH